MFNLKDILDKRFCDTDPADIGMLNLLLIEAIHAVNYTSYSEVAIRNHLEGTTNRTIIEEIRISYKCYGKKNKDEKGD